MNRSNLCLADLNGGDRAHTLQADFVWPIDQTVLLCVDRGIVHPCEMVEVERRGLVGGRKVEGPAMTSATVTLCARMTNNCFQGNAIRFTLHTRENLACAMCARCGVLFTARKHETRKKKKEAEKERLGGEERSQKRLTEKKYMERYRSTYDIFLGIEPQDNCLQAHVRWGFCGD